MLVFCLLLLSSLLGQVLLDVAFGLFCFLFQCFLCCCIVFFNVLLVFVLLWLLLLLFYFSCFYFCGTFLATRPPRATAPELDPVTQ